MTTAPALQFDKVTRSFGKGETGVAALQQVSVKVRSGVISGLIGPDGAGKTTLMRLAAGLLAPDEGKLQVMGLDVVASPLQVQSIVGYMPQQFGLYEDLSVQENLDLYADLHGIDDTLRQARYAELMQMTALGPFHNRLAGRLSGGMKQKLGLACTLLSTPKLLLLDEPTAGVDPVSRRELWAIIQRLVRQEAMSVLLSTAYLDEAERCDDIILLHDGRVLDQGGPAHFSAQVQGRTFHVSSTQLSKRKLHQQLSGTAGVLDAVIDNENVRLVMQEMRAPALQSELSNIADIRAVDPIFEDAFMALLKPAPTTHTDSLASSTSRPNTDEIVIAVNNVQKRFGQFVAVKDISFAVRRGEVFGLLGANGAGKSTTFRMLCGLLPASAGELKVAGHDLRHAAAHARSHLGYMAQRFSLYANLTVLENLKFFASAYGLDRQQRQQRMQWALQTFNLETYANDSGGDLPQGYKQRLALAAALMHEPDILFLDEPTSGVDPMARREFWHWINALAESGVTVLVTTHFMAEADYCDRLVIMAEGTLLASGTPAELKTLFRTDARPNPSMEEAFIGLIENRLTGREQPA